MQIKFRIQPSFFQKYALTCFFVREDHELRVFENKVLGRIYGPKREEVMGRWSKLDKEEFHNLHSSPNII
jgi:hypothetical protein